jgi:hypothetical protein
MYESSSPQPIILTKWQHCGHQRRNGLACGFGFEASLVGQVGRTAGLIGLLQHSRTFASHRRILDLSVDVLGL